MKGVANLNKDNVGITVLLSPLSNPSLRVCVSPTHLLFNPRRGEIKLSQLALLLAEMSRVLDQSGLSVDSTPCILCGDFNSVPYSPIYNFVTQGALNYAQFTGPQISGQERHHFMNALTAPLLPASVGLTSKCTYS